VISTDEDKMEKSPAGYLGKVRSNFLGTEFSIFDTGLNPTKAKGGVAGDADIRS